MSILQGECLSTDLELMQVIESLEAQSQETSQSAIEKAMNNSLNAVGTKVAYMLLKQEALLLPDAYDTFCECFEEEAEQNLPAEVSPNNLVTKQHLLSYLKAKLGKHLTYVTKIKSAGILLYRTGGDTLLSLTKALSQHRKSKQNGISHPHCSVSCTADSFDSQLVQVCTEMNNRLHVEAKQVIPKRQILTNRPNHIQCREIHVLH